MADAVTLDAAPPPALPHSCFTVAGLPSPQLLPRLIGLFAQQDLLPLELHMARGPELMGLRIVQDAIDPRRAGIILEKMRMLPEVSSASLADAGQRAALPDRGQGND